MKFLTQAAKVRNEQKKDKRRLAVFLCLAVIVALGTAAALKMYGQAMSHKDKRLICQVEAHKHTDQCYDGDKVICGYADYIVHTHNDDCYDGDGNLVCHLQEAPAHVHTDECYTEEKVLVCKEEEQAHQHTESCYTPEKGELQCQLEEHTHGEECYDSETGELTCEKEEHQHNDNCYAWEEVLSCPYAAEGHQHSDECYAKEKGDLQCQIEEHTHTAECYNENNELICEKEEHIHNDDCYAWNNVLTCQLEETPAGHTHTDACYETKKVLTCGQLELHTHDENCLDENGNLVCGLLELKEHTHQAECFETVELTDEEVAAKLEAEKLENSFHEGNANEPEDEIASVSEDASVSGDSISGNSVSEGSISGNSVSENNISGNSVSGNRVSGNSVSGNKAHIHTEKCYDEAGKLICGYAKEVTKTCKRKEYIVTATYSETANIPEEAELIAEQITKEDDAKHYAEREAEFQEALGDDKATMGALFKMGFYVNSEEIEPESPVTITVQFLDENGLNEGRPLKVVHFADKGSEVIEGDASKEGNATFEVSSFSEVALGNGTGYTEPDENGKLKIYKSFEYNEGKSFHITFRFDGEASLPQKDITTPEIEFGDEDRFIDESGSKEEPENEGSADVAGEGEESEGTEEGEENGGTEEGEETSTEVQEGGSAADGSTEGDVTDEEEVPTEDSKDESTEEPLQFNVKPLSEKSEKYQAISDYVDSLESEKKDVHLQAIDYSLSYNGVDLDLEECEVTVEVKPTGQLAGRVEELVANPKAKSSVKMGVLGIDENVQIDELGTVTFGEDFQENTLSVAMDSYAAQTAGFFSAESKKLMFTVQYYAYIDELKTTSGTSLPNPSAWQEGNKQKVAIEVIDTSGKNLPKNETAKNDNLACKYLYATGDNLEKLKSKFEFDYEENLKKIFTENNYDFGVYPQLENFNKFAREDMNYDLSEIWILKDGKNPSSDDKNDWIRYTKTGKDGSIKVNGDIKGIEFTNNPDVVIEGKRLLIKEGTVIRLIGDSNEAPYINEVLFYDYDITDGSVYDKNGNTLSRSGIPQNTDVYANTNQKGINSESNYTGAGKKYAFGNANTGTGLGGISPEKLPKGEYNINRANDWSKQHLYRKCSFGLVQDYLDENGNIQFSSGIQGPNLFGAEANIPEEQRTKGKKAVGQGYTLGFNRNGDTYTLSKVEGKSGAILSDLEKVQYTGGAWGSDVKMWVNQFWPMDYVETYDAAGHDLKFGKKICTCEADHDHYRHYKGADGTGNFPSSDDWQDHNSYFGMTFSVGFELTEDYTGPLNYYFFGDDDMWVFLDGQLICDIGGVHQAVGEYVNLWDWIEKGSAGSHELKFFYTERGASGSTCWMQFTLPGVLSIPVEYPNGSIKNTLKVGKTVSGDATDQAFDFTIKLVDKNKNDLFNTYPYQITEVDENGKEKIVKEGNIKNGDPFKLKNNQSIEVRSLPDGAKYTIQEKKYDKYEAVIGGTGTVKADSQTEGTIDWDGESQGVDYVNHQIAFELPETGGPGLNYIVYAAVALLASSAALLKYRQIRRRREGIGR